MLDEPMPNVPSQTIVNLMRAEGWSIAPPVCGRCVQDLAVWLSPQDTGEPLKPNKAGLAKLKAAEGAGKMTKTGFCQFGPVVSHFGCPEKVGKLKCDCTCHQRPARAGTGRQRPARRTIDAIIADTHTAAAQASEAVLATKAPAETPTARPKRARRKLL